MDIIPEKAPKSLISENTFFNYLLIVDSYSKIPKLCGMDKIAIEEMRDKLHIFQSRFGKIDGFFWWDLDRISVDAGTQIYLHGAPGCMPKPWCLFDVCSSGTPGNERTSQIGTENIMYNCTFTYGTCKRGCR